MAKPVVFPADFSEALRVAKISTDPSKAALDDAAEAVFWVAQRLVTASSIPTIGEIREIADKLDEIQRACLTVLQAVQLPEPLPGKSMFNGPAHALNRSRDPLVIALLDAANGPDGSEKGGVKIAQALHMIAWMASCAKAARDQFAAGVRREKASRQDPAARSPARELGFAMIETYPALTGRKLRFSRKKPGPESGGELDGPLIRYLMQLFECARRNLSRDPERAQLVDLREWHPSRETLAAWINQYRRAAGEL